MCGIAFVYRADTDLHNLSRDMESATAVMTPRGPDSGAMVCRHPWAMGHRRLAVIDPASSRQPMHDPTGRYALSYNGMLYNYRELRARLATRWRFQTSGDVEVVLAGLVLFGIDFLDRMEGMWALALWDQDTRTLLMVRDRMGQKPLYFQTDGKRFACASVLNALQPLSWFAWREDEHATADYLRYGFYLPGNTAFQGVYEVLPGHWLRWRAGHQPDQKPYWRLSTGGCGAAPPRAAEMLRQAIVDGVKRRLTADVAVGALLSGGVDSSLIVAIIRQELGRPLTTFTAGFDDPTFDERPHARRIARRFGCRHFESRLAMDRWDPLEELVLQHVGQPFGDSSLLPTAMVAKMAAGHVKVAISGDGGDELFGGYQRYLAGSLLRWYTRLPATLRGRAERLLAAFPEPGVHHSASLLKKAHLFVDLAARAGTMDPYVAPLNYTPRELSRLVPDLWRRGHQPPGLPLRCKSDDIHRMMVADALIYLPQDILAKVDRAGMAFSLEVRSPFLDRRVVELAFALPRRLHHPGWRGKRMPAQCFADLLPRWTWKRRKHGFSAPVHTWFRQGLQGRLKTLLHETRHPLQTSFVEALMAAHLSGRRDHGQRLWQIYIYLLWRCRGLTTPKSTTARKIRTR